MRRSGSRSGLLGCVALLLALLVASFPVLPAVSASADVLRLLERSRERYRRQDEAVGGLLSAWGKGGTSTRLSGALP